MAHVLVLGAGMVARPLVRHFLDRGARVTVASRTAARAGALVGGASGGRVLGLDVTDEAAVEPLVREADLTVSLVPYAHHVTITRIALRHRKPVVTTSYVSPAMRDLDAAARAAGVAVINECGLDPGIDHMGAMQVIDHARASGGRVTSFVSWCGGLPAPEANDNPFGYKFSWSPRGVLLAMRNPGRFLRGGREVEVAPRDLFEAVESVKVPGAGAFEGYPNRNSLDYIPTYGLSGVRTMFRGTLRYPGWCETWNAAVKAGWLDDAPADLSGRTFRQVFGGADELRARAGAAVTARAVRSFDWLGVFSDDPIPAGAPSRLDALALRMQERLGYRPGERDLIVLQHEFRVEYPDRAERVTATLVALGEPGGDTAMARTVSLPAAVAAEAVLDGRIAATGVLVPVTPDLYRPILARLAEWGIAFEERSETG